MSYPAVFVFAGGGVIQIFTLNMQCVGTFAPTGSNTYKFQTLGYMFNGTTVIETVIMNGTFTLSGGTINGKDTYTATTGNGVDTWSITRILA